MSDRTLVVELVVVLLAVMAIAVAAVSLVRGHDYRAAHDALHATERRLSGESDDEVVEDAVRDGVAPGLDRQLRAIEQRDGG